jgi:SAM-dependent methyltransferase
MKVNFEDKEAYNYLLSFDLFPNKQEGLGYLNDAYIRFKETVKIIPNLSPKAKVLELGANPYFLTLLLKRYYGLHPDISNYFNPKHKKRETQTINSKKFNEKHSFTYQHFNIETDKFPYKDKTYDLVLNCEILEHLTLDPVHSLQEIHRILKSDGYLVITTPNVNRQENWLKLAKGENIYDPYSGYGPYGRHNREYTINELWNIVFTNGFKVISSSSFLKSNQQLSQLEKLQNFILQKLFHNEAPGDHIYVVAQKNTPKINRPNYLYRSR